VSQLKENAPEFGGARGGKEGGGTLTCGRSPIVGRHRGGGQGKKHLGTYWGREERNKNVRARGGIEKNGAGLPQ